MRTREGLASVADRLRSFADALIPPPPMDVVRWAAEHRVVSAESGSPYPGRWDNARVPYLVEVQETLSFDDPCASVVFAKSAQVGVSRLLQANAVEARASGSGEVLELCNALDDRTSIIFHVYGGDIGRISRRSGAS